MELVSEPITVPSSWKLQREEALLGAGSHSMERDESLLGWVAAMVLQFVGVM